MYFSLSVQARVFVYGLECVLMCMSDVSLSVSLLSISFFLSVSLSFSLPFSPSLPLPLSQAGERILQVNATQVQNLTVEELTEALRGAPDTPVTLTLAEGAPAGMMM